MQRTNDSLFRQLVLTISYSNLFSQPLTTEEVFRRLIYSKNFKKAFSFRETLSALSELQQRTVLKKVDTYWQLSTITKDLSTVRKKRELLSALKIKELEPLILFAKKISWISGVALTGSVSVGNAEAKDDVDLMIVVQPQRLWLVRPLLVLFSFLHGKRRSWNHEEYNSWCLNLWLEENSVQLPVPKRTIYTAYEVCQAEWMFTKYHADEIFLVANVWVDRLLPNYFEWKLKTAGGSHQAKSLIKRNNEITADFWDWMNEYSYRLQLWYMHRHMTRERVSRSFAFFHPRDTRKNIMQSWKKSVTGLV